MSGRADSKDSEGEAMQQQSAVEQSGSSSAGLQTGFVSEQRLADLLFRREARRIGPGLIACSGRGFALCEAVRVLACTDRGRDPYGLVGTVERLEELLSAGASLRGTEMSLGRVCYRIERGVMALSVEPRGGEQH